MERRYNSTQRQLVLTILLLTGIGMASLLFATTQGIGVTPDSVAYLDLARNILDGSGFVTKSGTTGSVTPMIHFPPLFPAAVALFGASGVDPLLGARWLNLLLFGANIFLVGLILRRYTNGALYPTALGSFFMLSSPVMIESHSAAWSEPLFLFFGTAGLFSIAQYLETERKRLLIWGSLAIALAFLCRYVGGIFVAAAIGGIFLLERRGYRQKFVDASLLGLLSVSPIALWSLRNLSLAGSATGRTLHFKSGLYDHARALVATLSSWLVPGSDRIVLLPGQDLLTLVILFLTIVGLLAAGIKLLSPAIRTGGISDLSLRLSQTPILFGIFALLYIILLFVMIACLNPPPWFDNRLLSPVYMSGLIFVLFLTYKLFAASRHSAVRVALSIVGIGLVGIYAVAGTAVYIYLHEHGRGLTGKEWQFERIAAQLRALDPNTVIYSNYPPAVYFHTGRKSLSIPPLKDNSLPQISEMTGQIENGRAVVVYFHSGQKFALRTYAKTEQDSSEEELQNLLRLVSLSLVAREANASLYRTTRSVPNNEP